MTEEEIIDLVTIEKEVEQMQDRVKNLVFRAGETKPKGKNSFQKPKKETRNQTAPKQSQNLLMSSSIATRQTAPRAVGKSAKARNTKQSPSTPSESKKIKTQTKV